MKFGKMFLAFGIFLALFGSARAQEQTQPTLKDLFAKETEPRSYGSAEVWYSLYYFDESKIFEEFFDKEFFEPFGLSLGWYPVRNLDLLVRVGYAERKGERLGINTGEESEEDVRLMLIPVQAELIYRFDFFNEQFLVPSGGIGYDYWYFKEDNEYRDDVEGDKTGWHASAGLAILLERLDPSGKMAMQQDWGIENVFLNLEARWCWIEQGNGFDFSGMGYSAGLLFEF